MIKGMIDLNKRESLMNRFGICNDSPAFNECDAFRSGNGIMVLKDYGNPLKNRMEINHESLWCPQWEEPAKAPLLADYLPQIQQLVLDRKFSEAEDLIDKVSAERGTPPCLTYSRKHDALHVEIEQNDMRDVEEYLHVLNMANGEIVTHWENNGEVYKIMAFVSRADNIAVIRLVAPEGKLNCKLNFFIPHIEEDVSVSCHTMAGVEWLDNTIAPAISTVSIEDAIVIEGMYSYNQGNFITGVRPVCVGGVVTADKGTINIKNGTECLILVMTERSRTSKNLILAKDVVDKLTGIKADYDELLKSHIAIYKPIFDRVKLDLKGDEKDCLLTYKELKQKEFMSDRILPAYIEKMLYMGRYFMLCESGEFPPIYGHVNLNVNQQISGG